MLVVYEGVLGRPPVVSDMERQLAVGTYQLGNGPLLKVLLDGLPCDKAVSVEDDRLAFYLRGSAAVVVFNVLDLDS
ncbi:MAG: hypothetical protein QOE31_1134 [Solirubrobacteraceae bacterium]|nr:hypothetical protein [Solirubrobacteraceae bacterium]